MTKLEKAHIERISKEFASGFNSEIAGSEWIIVDPLSGYLNFLGYKNTLSQIPAKDNHAQILIMTFNDGTMFIPAGSDLPFDNTTDWMWL